MTKRSTGLLVMAVAGVTALAMDQLIKAWVVSNLAPRGSREVLEGFVRLRYAENTGAAFGLFRGWTGPLSILALVVVVAIIVSAQKIGGGSRMSMLALGLVIGGAVGNLVDRVRLGYVVDFIEVYAARVNLNDTVYTFPVFNTADSAITIGVLLLLLAMFLRKDVEPVTTPEDTVLPAYKSSPWFTRPKEPASRHAEEPKIGESELLEVIPKLYEVR